MSAAVASVNTSITSWWYSQGRAVEVARRLETLQTLTPPPGPVGAVTVSRGHLTVAFQQPLKAPLPQPWQPAGPEARIDWDAVDPGSSPDPNHPVYLVVLGTKDDEALVALNLAAFSRIRIGGDPDTARGLVRRWVLELIATHPTITMGLTEDVWPGPFTTRVWPVSVGRIPDVDVLILGPDITYADRAQIAASVASPILLDLGDNAAVTTTWSVTCGPDRRGTIGNERNAIAAALLIPNADVTDMCRGLLTGAPSASTPAYRAGSLDVGHELPADDDIDEIDDDVEELEEDAGADLPGSSAWPAAPPAAPLVPPQPVAAPPLNPTAAARSGNGAKSVAEHDVVEAPTSVPASVWGNSWDTPQFSDSAETPVTDPSPAITDAPPSPPAVHAPGAASSRTATVAPPRVAVIWNRILGPITLCPPHGGAPHPREPRLNELTVYLQEQGSVKSDDILADICGGGAVTKTKTKTVTGQLSVLRTRLGSIRPDGENALSRADPEGYYHLLKEVRSDWMEFDRLVDLIPTRSDTEHLVAAMELVTGPPLGGIRDDDWIWATSLRDQLRSRIPEAAVTLAQRYYEARNHSAALEVASKGLWYDALRQDLLAVALRSAGESGNHIRFRELRSHYLAKVPDADRDPAVYELIGRAE